ncbi:hypothetical protein NEDG_00608 [Nematocida displodere]|uniref:Rab-GAP TBC domain-containing protein n=1 Tax=Nematocida displodere TaxID=1805483 RepID=A0A177EC00_9MICR|nr:hypothetical protein NEDG_00608 [Nematocida displodere]
MWLEVCSEDGYLIEKRVDNVETEEESAAEGVEGPEYSTAALYMVNEQIGRFRLRKTGAGMVICGSDAFNELLQWMVEDTPTLQESVCYRLGLGSYVKYYESVDCVVILGTLGMAVFGKNRCQKIPYMEIEDVYLEKRLVIRQKSGVEEVDAFDRLGQEIVTLALQALEGPNLEESLLLQTITERVASVLPIYNQQIKMVFITEGGSLSVTEDFLIVKEDKEYLMIPLEMLRVVEIRKESKTLLMLVDSNRRAFEYTLLLGRHTDDLLKHMGRKREEFKVPYINTILDMIEAGIEESVNTTNALFSVYGNNDINSTSEYRIYVRGTEKDPSLITCTAKERPFIWLEYFCVSGMSMHHHHYIHSHRNIHTLEHSVSEQIEIDVGRSAYDTCTALEAEGLKRVLLAFAVTSGGDYLQSHALVGMAFFRVLGEFGSFVALHYIFGKILPRYSGSDIYGLKRDVHVLHVLMKEKFPGLCDNLSEKSIEIEILTAPWLLSLFTTVFARVHLEQVFDYIGVYGASFVFRVALALIERMYRGLSRSEKEGSLLKSSKNYLFSGGSTPSMTTTEFQTVVQIAITGTVITPERIIIERNRYDLSHRE